jgi:molecular chaperone GrpE
MESDQRAAASGAAAPDSGTTTQEADVTQLLGDLAAAKTRAEEAHQKLLYAMAEVDNVKKRSDKIVVERLASGRKALIGKFLPIIDNLHRALAFEITSDRLREGLQATLRGFEAALASEQVKQINVLGLPFDPRLAEAIGTRETDDVADSTVVDEVQRGYLLGEELLRPAQVIVSKRKTEAG